MALNPEFLYPNYPKLLNGIRVGMSVGSAWQIKYYFGDVSSISLSGFDLSQEPYFFELMSFPNGLKVFGRIYYDPSQRTMFLSGVWRFNGNDIPTPPGVNMFSVNIPYDAPYRSGLYYDSVLHSFDCVYNANPTEGVSQAAYISSTIFFDAWRYVNILPGDMVKLECELSEKVSSGREITGTEILRVMYNGDSYEVTPAKVSIFNIVNLETFNTYMKTAGNGQDDDVWKPDITPEDDTSGPGGGGGNYDDRSDPIDFPDLPTGGALDSGAIVAHRVSKQTLYAIMQKLWSNSIFDIGNMWQKSISDPMDAIVSLHALPFSPEVDGSTPIWIGNFDTELSSPEVTSQYIELDCGTLNIREFWGSALDYSPYTRAEIFLPFIGVKDVAIEDVMNSKLHIKYHIDVLTGDCVAFIKCGLSVLYHFTGNCRMTIPLSSYTTDALQNTIGETGKMISGAAIGAAVGGGIGMAAGMTISSAANVASSKIRLNKGSELGGSVSLMDDFVPYMIFHRPVQSLAKDYNKFKGYPSNITATLGSLSGYTEVEHIHLDNLPNATNAEMEEIKNLLKQGVLL